MEQLIAYALLCSIGCDCYSEFQNVLDSLFLDNPDDSLLLDLYDRQYKDAVLHVLSLLPIYQLSVDSFGECLMDALKPIYRQYSIREFAQKMYQLWSRLPQEIGSENPFHILSFADDCLLYGDENQCRQLYETALEYYSKGGPSGIQTK